MYQIQEEVCFASNFEYPLFQMDSVNTKKKLAGHNLIQSFVLSLNVKSKLPIPELAIFGSMDADENVPFSFRISKGKLDNFIYEKKVEELDKDFSLQELREAIFYVIKIHKASGPNGIANEVLEVGFGMASACFPGMLFFFDD